MQAQPHLRDATPDDLPAILAIYNDAVANTTAIWNETIVDLDNRRAWMAERNAAGFPVLVAETEGQVAGYATYGLWRPHDGFRHTVEHSVYVAADARGQGFGEALLRALIERARSDGLHVMVGAIDASNAGSIALHRKLGFEGAGVVPQVGAKFGRWLDLAFLALRLDDQPEPPR
ncbi:GNAT family N-acetyltransferase [Stakelama tenebrarum]|uniref:N-acetyltransferase n=1 Tax=Stakelama tenebrarum TaxID=2711215 RepID=A0A6G6Y7A4_9SPHN|nr:GNAT family N-acetyltransferase [Sphingosinithalassobacter tenebrarum]QIG80731.1 N-acetyltransferase [Sphingosinithalassobacter tenebrarum]